MKRRKRVIGSVLALVLALSAALVQPAGTVQAAQPYTYTVTFYAGNRGSFAAGEDGSVKGLSVSNTQAAVTYSKEKIVISGLAAGDEIGLTAQAAVELEPDDKYYVKGIRMSGRDNSTVAAAAFVVKGDADYVAAYGIRGNQVAYTVSYLDKNGRELSEAETFYGNVGDKPVVAYKYIEGYAPQALGLTKTLSANGAENVFTFVYEEMPEPTIDQMIVEKENVTTQTVVIGGTVVAPGQTGNAGTQPGTGIGEGNQPGTEAGTENGEDAGAGTDEGGQDSATTGDGEEAGQPDGEEEEKVIQDLDEEEIPLADPDIEKNAGETARPLAIYIGAAAIGLLALIAVIIFIISLKKDKKEDVEAEDAE